MMRKRGSHSPSSRSNYAQLAQQDASDDESPYKQANVNGAGAVGVDDVWADHGPERTVGVSSNSDRCEIECTCRKCAYCSGICALVSAILLYWVLFYSHHWTCSFNIGLCTPFIKYVYNSDPMYQNELSDEMINKDAPQLEECSLAWDNPCPQKFEFAIVLGQKYGGTGFLSQNMAQHPQTMVGGALMNEWFDKHCGTTKFAKTDPMNIAFGTSDADSAADGKCNAQTFIAELTSIFQTFIDSYSDICKVESLYTDTSGATKLTRKEKHKREKIIYIFTLYIDQIPPQFFAALVHYLQCQQITVLQLIRDATIASFWELESEKQSIVRGLDDSQEVSKLDLDGKTSKRYVELVENNRATLRNMIKWYPKNIKHEEFSYEDMLGIHTKRYWGAIEGFLGVGTYFADHVLVDGNDVRYVKSSVLNEEKQSYKALAAGKLVLPYYSLPCFQRISNWDTVRPYLIGTNSYYSCYKQTS